MYGKSQFGMTLLLGIIFAYPLHSLAQGLLTPTGGPSPSMKTLEQIESRRPIAALPVTIDVAGSYYLTTNLIGSAGSNGITIQANGVTLDLNGFLLTGSGTNSGHGIFQDDIYHSTHVQNGSVANWNGADQAGIQLEGENNRVEGVRAYDNNIGVFAGAGAVIKNCTVFGNGGDSLSGGIIAGPGSVLSGCTVYENEISGGTGLGIFVGEGSIIEGCTAVSNQFSGVSSAIGIFGGSGSIIRNCTAHHNTSSAGFTAIGVVDGGEILDCSAYANSSASSVGVGISGGNGTVIRDSSAHSNTANGSSGFGISSGSGATITGCTVYGEKGAALNRSGIFALFDTLILACTVSNNTNDGIRVGRGCLIRESLCSENSRYGIYVTSYGNKIEHNMLRNNDAGIFVQSTNNLIVANSATGNVTTNYSIAAGNTYGPIVSTPGVGDLSGVLNANHPLSNLSY